MANHLLTLQKEFENIDIASYYLSATPESRLAQLNLELQYSEIEQLAMEICEIPVPDSPLFILQFFVPLPLPPPFEPDEKIPEFVEGEVQKYTSQLNQVLPLIGFFCTNQKIFFRTTAVFEEYTMEQILYTLETIEKLIQKLLPSLQEVAIGMETATAVFSRIDQIFTE